MSNISADQSCEVHKCMHSPSYFTQTYLKLRHPCHGTLPFQLYDYQERYMMNLHTEDNVIAMMPRQSGLSYTTLAFTLWYMLFNADKLVVLFTRTTDMGCHHMERLHHMLDHLPHWMKPVLETNHHRECRFDNGSALRIRTTAQALRDMTIDMLIVEDLPWFTPQTQNDLDETGVLNAGFPVAQKRIVYSTPNCPDDLFRHIWSNAQIGCFSDEWGDERVDVASTGDNGFVRFKSMWRNVPSSISLTGDHTYRGEDFKKEQLQHLTEDEWNREFELEFQ